MFSTLKITSSFQIDFPAAGWEYVKPDSEEKRNDVEGPPKECLKHIARLSQKQTPLLWVSQAWEWLSLLCSRQPHLEHLCLLREHLQSYTSLSFPEVMVLDDQLMWTNWEMILPHLQRLFMSFSNLIFRLRNGMKY